MEEQPIPPGADHTDPRLLVIDDEANMRDMLAKLLGRQAYRVTTAENGWQALDLVSRTTFDYVLCDLKMPEMDGMAFLEAARPHLAASTVIVMSAYGTMDTAIEAMKLGAYDYISKPFKFDEVHLALKKAEERENLRRENRRLKQRLQELAEPRAFGQMVAQSRAMQAVFKLAGKVARFDTTVIIHGESGTGKELIARGIHHQSRRAQGPLIPVNCGGIPENLLESEFFGYTKGAFTGADRNQKGLFEEAHGGTLFLDEIGELPLALQVKLLRVLQEGEIRPLGSTKTRKVDVRIVAATAKDLEHEVSRGRFREDLFYRLNVMPIHLPSLRERSADIAPLCQHFINQFNARFEIDIQGVSPAALMLLSKHPWPGNVRELENVIERAVVLAEKRIILPENLPAELGAASHSRRIDDFLEGFSLKEAQKTVEKRLITRALEATGGNRTKAIALLEISHPSLLSKMKAYDIKL
ncbi:MAG: sigma-54 dependent transcriptional regulator [Desulfobacterales bacterium]